ncbi:MAG: type II toxin-antitoxin system VapC family toxin [Terriglobales bacterium]
MIFLDTHVVVWVVADEDRLSRPAASAIRRARNSDGIAIADVVIWELAFLLARGVLRTHNTIEKTVENFIVRSGVTVQSITPEIATIAAQFPDSYPKDPIDRIVGATARAAGLALVTKDERIRSSPLVKTIW